MKFRTLRPSKFAAAAFAVGAIALASGAQAHPRLVSAQPAANSSIAATKELRLTFSETLVAQFSGMSIMMTAMPSMKTT